MQTKDLKEINNIFEDIRQAVNTAAGEEVITECDPRNSYAKKIARLSENEETLPFLFDAVVEDDNAETPDVSYHVNEEGTGVFSFRLSRGIAGSEGAPGKDGKDGRDGIDGVDGEKGDKGDPGEDGKDGNSFKFIYLALPDTTIDVAAPVYNPDKDGDLPYFNGVQWTEEPSGVSIAKQIEYVSQSEFTATGWSKWSYPAVWARWSKDGEPGKDGKDGIGRSIFIYTSTATIDSPDTPQGGSWDPETNTITAPEGWFDNVPEERETYLWLSNAFFANDGITIESWSTPVRLTGENGQDGVDGNNIEFIYRLLPNRDTYIALREYINDGHPLTSGATLEVPAVNDDLGIEPKWTNNPSGIDGGNYLIEVVCSRTKKDDVWSAWSLPTYWSMWGEDGMDGAGVEYIFRITSEEFTSDMLLAEFKQHDIYNHPDYQKDNFYPGGNWGVKLDWTDEPSDVSETEPIEWVCIRKKIDGIWGEFSEPKVWGKYAKDGYAFKTSYVFTRAISQPKQPYGGTYNEPYPTILGVDGVTIQKDPIWSDTVPAGLGEIYMTYRTFYSGPEIVDEDWSTPVKMTDTADFQVEYSTRTEKPAIGSLQPYYENYINGVDTREYEIVWREDNTAWSDDGTNAVWMATSVLKSGKWTDWSVVKVKGEQGDAGKDGTSIEIKGTAVEVFDFPNEPLTDENGNTIHYILFNNCIYKFDVETTSYQKFEAEEIGDGFVVNRNFWIWDGYRWYNAGEIKGADGESAWFIVKFSDDKIEFTADNGTEPGRYIGMLFGVGAMDENKVNDPNNYEWSIWSGEDGWGWEQIFLLTAKDSGYNEDNPPVLPTDNTKVLDHVPDGWTDTPGSVSSDFPYCWSAKRKASRSEIENWKGDPKKPGYASLYSRYSYDGKDGIGSYYLELTNDQIIVPVEKDGSIDPDFVGGSTRMILYCGDEVVEPNDEKPITYSVSVGTVNDGDVILTAEDLKDVSEVTCKATYNGTDFYKTLHVIKTSTAYDITVNRAVLTRGEDGYFIEGDKEIIVTILRWNADHWYGIDNQGFNVSITHLDGTVDTDESYITTNGKATVTLSDEQDVRSIKIYFTKNDIEYFEEVGVIADGKQGPQGPEGSEGPKGESGKDAFAFDLTNDNDTILADSEGNIIGDLPQTTAKLYFGNVLVETGIDYTVTVTGGTLSGDSNRTNKGVETFAFESITEDKAIMTIKAVYADIEYEKNFTITRVIGTADYNLHLSNYVISRNDDTTKIVTITAEKVENGETTACTFGENILVNASNEDGETKDLTEYLVDNKYNIPYSVIIDYPIFSLYVDGVNWHTQQIVIIRDGADGIKGESGENTIVMALSNPSGTFQYSGDRWLPSADEVTSLIEILDGFKNVTEKCTISLTASEGIEASYNEETFTVTVTPGTINIEAGRHEVVISAFYTEKNVTLHKVLTIIASAPSGESPIIVTSKDEYTQITSHSGISELSNIENTFYAYWGTTPVTLNVKEITFNEQVLEDSQFDKTEESEFQVITISSENEIYSEWLLNPEKITATIDIAFDVTFDGRTVQRNITWKLTKLEGVKTTIRTSVTSVTENDDNTVIISIQIDNVDYSIEDPILNDYNLSVWANNEQVTTSAFVINKSTTFVLKSNDKVIDYQTVTYLKNGFTPTIEVKNGYWYINGVVTEFKVGIESVDSIFTKNNSNTEAPESPEKNPDIWTTDAPVVESTEYLWSCNKITYSSNEVSYTSPACISGTEGVGIQSVTECYAYSESRVELPIDTTWYPTHDPLLDDNLYVWTKLVIVYTDGNEKETDPVCQTGATGVPGADGVSIVWKGESSTHLSPAENGWAYRNTTDHKVYVYQDGWYTMTMDGLNGKDGKDGTSISIKGSLESETDLPTPPTNASDCYIIGSDLYVWTGSAWKNVGQFKGDKGEDGEGFVYIGEGKSWYEAADTAGVSRDAQSGWCYRDTSGEKPIIYVFDGNDWEVLIEDGNPGADGTNGLDGLSVFITYNDNDVDDEPNPPTGDGNDELWHTTSHKYCNWISQKVAKSADDPDVEWGNPIKIAGDNSLFYTINGSHRIIVRSSTGIIITPKEDIVFKVTKINGKKSSIIENLDSENLVIWYNLDGDKDKMTSISNISPADIQERFTLYLCENTIDSYESAIINYKDMFEVIVVKQEKGENGEKGKDGKTLPLIYPAGEFDELKAINGEYVGTSNQAPYVFYNPSNGVGKGYYIAYGTPLEEPILNDNIITNDTEIDWNNIPEDAASWVEMEKYNAIYSDIGMFGSALVGKWVFEGDYMYSQLGIDSETLEEVTYDLWLGNPIPAGEFIPNIKINARTGEAWFARQNFELGNDGSIKLRNADVDIHRSFENIKFQFKVDGDGILIDYNGKHSIQVTQNGIKIGNFFISETGGLSYSSNNGGVTINPTNFSVQDIVGTVNIMQEGGTECVYVNPQFLKNSTNRSVGFRASNADIAFEAEDSAIAFQAPTGIFSGLRPKIRTVSKSIELDEFDHTIVASNSSTVITLPFNPPQGQEYIIICTDGGIAINSDAGIYNMYNGGGGPVTNANRATYHAVYDAMWYITPLYLK